MSPLAEPLPGYGRGDMLRLSEYFGELARASAVFPQCKYHFLLNKEARPTNLFSSGRVFVHFFQALISKIKKFLIKETCFLQTKSWSHPQGVGGTTGRMTLLTPTTRSRLPTRRSRTRWWRAWRACPCMPPHQGVPGGLMHLSPASQSWRRSRWTSTRRTSSWMLNWPKSPFSEKEKGPFGPSPYH